MGEAVELWHTVPKYTSLSIVVPIDKRRLGACSLEIRYGIIEIPRSPKFTREVRVSGNDGSYLHRYRRCST